MITVLCGLLCTSLYTVNAQTSTIAETTPVVEKTMETLVVEKTMEVKVKGVGCSRDCQAISFNVAKLSGVSHCRTVKKGATTTFEVTYAPSIADEKAIYSAIENTAGCSKQKDKPYKVKL